MIVCVVKVTKSVFFGKKEAFLTLVVFFIVIFQRVVSLQIDFLLVTETLVLP